MSATTQATDANGATPAKKARNARAKMTIDATAKTVTFNVRDAAGEPLTDAKHTFVARLDALPKDIVTLLALDRLRNKLMDSYSDPASDILTECKNTYETLLAGNWAARGEGAERTTLFVEAYAEHFKVPLEEARAKINDAMASDDAARKAKVEGIRKHPTIVAIMARIGAAKAAERAKNAAGAAKGVTAVAAL